MEVVVDVGVGSGVDVTGVFKTNNMQFNLWFRSTYHRSKY